MISTELEAVNTMMRAIGQVPVTIISEDPFTDSAVALQVLNEYTGELQHEGYDFNTNEKVELTPDIDGKIAVDANIVRLRSYYAYRRFTVRGGYLYDLDNRTDEFDSSVFVNTIFNVGFEELPELLQRYVIIRSARVFANRMVGEQTQNAYNGEDETRARLAWFNAVAEDMDLNVMSSASHLRPSTFRPYNTTVRNLHV